MLESGPTMRAKRKLLCVSTSKPTSALTAGGGGGALTLICPRTGSIQSSLRVAGDLAGKVPLGVASLSTFPSKFASDNSSLAIGFGGTAKQKEDAYGMLFTLRTATLPPILHWKCRLPEAQMTAGLVVSPCGQYIVGGSVTGTLYIWSAIGGLLLKTVKAHYRSVDVLTWSTCGRHLITGGADGMVHVFSLIDLTETSSSTVHPIRTWTKHHLAVTAIVPLGGGGRIASTSQDGQINLLEIFSGSVLASIQLPHPVVSMAEKDNRLFAGTASGSIHILDLDDYAVHRTTQLGATVVKRRDAQTSHRQSVFGRSDTDETPYLVELQGHGRAVTAMNVFSDDAGNSSGSDALPRDWLVSGDESGVVRVWDLTSRSCVRAVYPWSHTGAKASTAKVSSHPVTSINVLEETISGEETGGLFSSNSNAGGRNTRKKESTSSLVTALQRFAQHDQATPLAVPFLRPTRDLNCTTWNVTSEPKFSFSTALMNKRRRLEQSNAPAKKSVPSVTVDNSEKTAALEKELEEARATIKRWEAVNNKLMERLQK